MTVTIKSNNGLKKLANLIKQNSQTTLQVGFLTQEQSTIAAKQEFGGVYSVSQEYQNRAKAKNVHLPNHINIPARPFMQITFNQESKNWSNKFQQLFIQNKNIDQSLRILGNIVKTDIQKTITNANSLFKPNSPRTVIIKGKDSVLRDSGDLLNSVNFDVVTK